MNAPSSRAKKVVAAALVIGAGLGVLGLLRSRARRAQPGVGPRVTERAKGPDLRAALPAWARDPDAEPGTVEGVVRAPEGAPVEGALVALIPDLGEAASTGDRVKPAATARTAADGHFRLSGVRPGEYGATATAAGFAGGFAPGLVVLPGENVTGVEIMLERGGVALKGRVLDAGGGGVPRAEVRVLAGLSGEKRTRVFQTLADDAGAFAITVPTGRYMIVADAEGYAPDSRFVDTAATRTIDLTLKPAARLAGRAVTRADGRPVPDAQVVLDEDQIWWRAPRETKSDADGRFEFRDLDPGSYRVAAHKGRLIGAAPSAVDVALATRTAEVTVELSAGLAIAGHVLEAGPAAKPIPGARVRMSNNPFGLEARVRAVAGEDGRYRIEGVLPARLTLWAETPGHAASPREVVLAAGKDLEGVDLVVNKEAVVVGQVLGKDERPAAGVTVTAQMSEGTVRRAAAAWAADRTDGEGRFRLGGLDGGQLRVIADAAERGRASFGPEPLAAGETKSITLKLQPGASVSGTVTWDEGGPAAGVTVTAFVPEGMGMSQAKTGPDGAYELGPLPAGQASVMASRKEGFAGLMQTGRRGAQNQMKLLSLGPNERKRGVDLVVEKGGRSVAGVVLDSDGKPLAGASVGARAQDDMLGGARAAMGKMLGEAAVMSGEDGRFVIEDLAQGPYTVWAKSPGLPDAETSNVPTNAREVRVMFKRPAVLAGVAVDQAGKALTDFTVRAIEAGTAGKDGEAAKARQMVKSMTALFGGGGGQTVHDERGAFEIKGLGAGAYDVLVTAPDGQVGKASGITVAAGERKVDVRVLVRRGTALRGKIVEHPTGAPVAGLMIILLDAEQPMMRNAGADGTFRIEGLAPGRTVQLTIGGPTTSFVPEVKEIALPDGRPEVDAGSIKVVRGQRRFQDAGPGLGISVENDKVLINAIAAGSAAAEAGLKAGQRLVSIDGHDITGLGRGGVGFLLEGAPGTEVTVGVAGPGAEPPRTVTLARRAIEEGPRAMNNTPPKAVEKPPASH